MNKNLRIWQCIGWLSLTLLICWPALASAATTRTLFVSPLAFCRNTTSADFVTNQDFPGLKWAANSSEEAGFYLSKPLDWDGKSNITVTIYFTQEGAGACSVNWRLKINSYTPNSGEWLTNPGARSADSILDIVSGPSFWRVYSQRFTISATDYYLSSGQLWSFFFLRGTSSNGETCTNRLGVLNVEVKYDANSPVVVVPLN